MTASIEPDAVMPSFTAKQGQYLAFIYYYTKSTAPRPPRRTSRATSA
jgi:hypothetical protein